VTSFAGRPLRFVRMSSNEPTPAAVKRSAANEQAKRFMRRVRVLFCPSSLRSEPSDCIYSCSQTEGQEDPAFSKPAGHIADPQAEVYGAGVGTMWKTSAKQPSAGDQGPTPEVGAGSKAVHAVKDALGLGGKEG